MDNKIVKDILEWGRDKGINNPMVQFKKSCEETLEAQEAYVAYMYGERFDPAYNHLLEEIGDIGVVWLLLCQSLSIDPLKALETAHKKNRDRTGRTVNGNFIKDENNG